MMFVDDFRYALRLLAKKPGFTALTLLVMAAGIGLSVYLFSFMHTVAFKDLPFEDSESLIQISWSQNGVEQSYGMDFMDFHEIRDNIRGLSEVTGYQPVSVNVSGRDGARRFAGAAVEAGIFQITRTEPLLGRAFKEAETQRGAEKVVVIGHRMWRNRFGGDRGAIDRNLRINGENHRIIGVMPEGYVFPASARLWLPMRHDPTALKRGDQTNVHLLGHLKEGISTEDIDRQLAVIMQRLEEQYPETNKGSGAYSHTIPMSTVGGGIMVVYALHVSAVLVLILASINIGNLLLSRAIERGKETSIRMALGAPRLRLIGQMLWESIIICGVGGLIGLLVLAWGLGVTGKIMSGFAIEDPPFWWDFGIDGYTLTLFFVFVAATTLITGLLPAWRNSRGDFNAALRDGTRGALGGKTGRLNRLLVISEIFLSLTVLIPAVTMITSSYKLAQAGFGPDTDNILVAKVNLNESRYASPEQRVEFADKLESRLQNNDAVGDVMLASSLPGDWSSRPTVAVEGREYTQEGQAGYPRANYVVATPGTLEALGVELKQGRYFENADNRPGQRSVIVTDSFVSRHFGEESPIGKRLRIVETDGDQPRWLTIVGVIEHLVHGGPNQPVARAPSIYRPFAQAPRNHLTIAMEMLSDQAAATYALRDTLESIDPELPAFKIETYENLTDRRTDPMVFISTVFMLFGATAFILAASGIYGVMLNTITQRTQEIGIKRALGAQDGRILKEFLTTALKQLLWGGIPGLLAGSAMTFGLSRIMGFTDNLAIIPLALAALVTGIVVLSAWFPTRRALAMEPGEALRYE